MDNNFNKYIRRVVEIGIGAIAIGMLILAGCGGGGGGSAGGSSTSSSTLLVSPSLGWFGQGATVRVRDHLGNLLDSQKVDATGKATLNVPNSATAPLLVEAGVNGDKYFDEHTGNTVTISGIGANTGAIRAIVPTTTLSQVGVTPLTEIAAGGLINASGVPLTGITAASAIGANAAVGQIFGIADPLTPPTIVSGVGASNTVASLGSATAADQYALKLAALSSMAATNGMTAQGIAQSLSANLNSATPASSVATIVTAMQTELNNIAINNTNAATVANSLNIPVGNPSLFALAQGAALVAQNAFTSNPSANLATIIAAAQRSASSVQAAIANGMSPASAVANTGAAVAAVNDLIATGMSTAGLQSYQGSQPALAGAASGIPVGDVTKLTVGATAGSYIATDVTYTYSYTSGTWSADTTGKYSNYVLTASGWVLDNHGGTAVNNNDGTITLTDKHGTYTVNVFETRLDGEGLGQPTGTAPPYTYPYHFPTNSLFFYGSGGVSSQDSYELWTNGGVTDMNGTPLTTLPTIGTAFCANGFVLTSTPTPTAGNYNLMGSLFGMGGCTQSNIAGVTGTSSLPISGTTVSVQIKATGINSTSVILITSNMPYLNNCILGVVGGVVQIGCPIEFNMGSSGGGGFTPKGTPIYSSIQSHNKTAMDAELNAFGLPPLP